LLVNNFLGNLIKIFDRETRIKRNLASGFPQAMFITWLSYSNFQQMKAPHTTIF